MCLEENKGCNKLDEELLIAGSDKQDLINEEQSLSSFLYFPRMLTSHEIGSGFKTLVSWTLTSLHLVFALLTAIATSIHFWLASDDEMGHYPTRFSHEYEDQWLYGKNMAFVALSAACGAVGIRTSSGPSRTNVLFSLLLLLLLVIFEFFACSIQYRSLFSKAFQTQYDDDFERETNMKPWLLISYFWLSINFILNKIYFVFLPFSAFNFLFLFVNFFTFRAYSGGNGGSKSEERSKSLILIVIGFVILAFCSLNSFYFSVIQSVTYLQWFLYFKFTSIQFFLSLTIMYGLITMYIGAHFSRGNKMALVLASVFLIVISVFDERITHSLLSYFAKDMKNLIVVRNSDCNATAADEGMACFSRGGDHAGGLSVICIDRQQVCDGKVDLTEKMNPCVHGAVHHTGRDYFLDEVYCRAIYLPKNTLLYRLITILIVLAVCFFSEIVKLFLPNCQNVSMVSLQ